MILRRLSRGFKLQSGWWLVGCSGRRWVFGFGGLRGPPPYSFHKGHGIMRKILDDACNMCIIHTADYVVSCKILSEVIQTIVI